MPVGCLLRLTPGAALLLVIITLGGCFLLFQSTNINIGGISAADYQEIHFTDRYHHAQYNDIDWDISYETGKASVFLGTIRHISPIRMHRFALLTHDILVTSGDFADPDLVRTSVINHKFFWRSRSDAQPQGTINLLHTVAIDSAVYDTLWSLKNGQTVQVTGYEILRISLLDENGAMRSYWEDHGCNTLLISEITVLD